MFCRELGLDSFVGTSVFRITFYVPFCFFFLVQITFQRNEPKASVIALYESEGRR